MRFSIKKSLFVLSLALVLSASCFVLTVSASNARCDYMAQCNVTPLHELGITGKYADGTPVRVVVIDSGIDYDHAAFLDENGQSIISPLSYNASSRRTVAEYGCSVVDDQKAASYHGTSVCGTIISRLDSAPGVAPDVELVVIRCDYVPRTDGSSGNAFEVADLLHAVDYAISLDPAVISLSWTISNYDSNAERLAALLQKARDNNILVCVAAGNTASTNLDCPANLDSVLTVGWIEADETLASTSCHGADVELVAPGSVLGIKYGGGVWNANGTSFACPIVAGIAALYISTHPDATVDQIIETLCSTARDLGEFGQDDYYGYGIPDAYAACMADKASLTLVCEDNVTTLSHFLGNIDALNAIVPETDGIFTGWYYDEAFTQPVGADDIFWEDTTLYGGVKYSWTLYDGYVDVIATLTDYPGTALTYPDARPGFTCWTEDETPDVLGRENLEIHLYWTLDDLAVVSTPTDKKARENGRNTDTFTFEVSHPLADQITYTWTKYGVVLPGETSNTLTLYQDKDNTGTYTCTASLSAGGQTRTESCSFAVIYIPERRLPWFTTPLALLLSAGLCILYIKKRKKTN